MNESIITENAENVSTDIVTESEPIRKIGFINGFTTCNDDYLIFACNEIGLDAEFSEIKKLQTIFKTLGRCPTVAELFFALKGLRSSKSIAENKIRLTNAELPDEDVKILLSDLVRRYSLDCSANGKAPVITELAHYSATGKATQPECGIIIEKTEYRALPQLFSADSATVSSGDISLTLSRGKPLVGTKRGKVCVLISAEDNNYSDEYLNRMIAACRKIYRSFRDITIIPTSRFGLIYDLSEFSDGLWIDTSLFPSPTKFAEDVFDAPAPSFMIFADRFMLPTIWQIAWEFKIIPKAPITLRSGNITINAEAGMVDIDRKIMSMFNWEISGDMSFDGNAIGEIRLKEEFDVFNGEYSIELFSLSGGNIYGVLEDTMSDPDADYAIGGILCPFDDKALPAIISLDAYRRNCAPNISYAKFFIGDQTDIRIFKIKAKKQN